MKKYLTLLLLFSFIVSCEKDDICIDETTPHLIIVFYDKDDATTRKKVAELQVDIKSTNEELVKIDTFKATDSIAIPLQVNNDFTEIHLTKILEDKDTKEKDIFTLNYKREDIFVSRSCGYKTIFKSNTISDVTENWIDNITIITPDIVDEETTHIHIFH